MIEVTWLDAIDPPWLRVEPVCIGDVPSGLGTPAKYILVAQDDEPLLRVDAYPCSNECFTFREAIVWHGWLVVGWGDCAYLVDLASRHVVKHSLGFYFGHVYAYDEFLLIASGDRLRRVCGDGSLEWSSGVLGVDGILVRDISEGIILGDGEWDPPNGWREFRIDLASGRQCNLR